MIYRPNNKQSATPASLQMLRADISSQSHISTNMNDHQSPRHKPLQQLSGIKSVYCVVPAPFIQGSFKCCTNNSLIKPPKQTHGVSLLYLLCHWGVKGIALLKWLAKKL